MFLAFLKEAYPGIRQLRFKKKKRAYIVRAQYGPRELFTWDKSEESAASRFLGEIKRKIIQTPLVINRYYASLDIV